MATTPNGYGRFIGRVGGLAVALGIGAAIANSPVRRLMPASRVPRDRQSPPRRTRIRGPNSAPSSSSSATVRRRRPVRMTTTSRHQRRTPPAQTRPRRQQMMTRPTRPSRVDRHSADRDHPPRNRPQRDLGRDRSTATPARLPNPHCVVHRGTARRGEAAVPAAATPAAVTQPP